MKKLMAIAVAIVLILTMAVGVSVAAAPGNVLHVPSEFPTIQAAINAATSGDTVLVAAGTYSGTGNQNILLKSGVVIQAAEADVTIIDCQGKSRAVWSNYPDSTAKLDGFTITGGYALLGGGIYLYNGSSPVISNCTFLSNSAVFGGGISCASNASPTVTNCTFLSNSATVGGGGMYNQNSSPTVTNCTFVGNSAPLGTGLHNNESSPTLTNCILWDNGAEIFNEISTPVVTYCDIQGEYSGEGNIWQDPMFVNPAANDYHLQPGSPCIDAGNNDAAEAVGLTTDFEGDPRIWPEGGVVDIGVDEFVPANQPPEADAGGLYTVPEGGIVPLSGTGFDPDLDPLTYNWDLDNDGTFETVDVQYPTFLAAERDGSDTQIVVLQVCDDDGACDTDEATVNILNVAPVVGSITMDPISAVVAVNVPITAIAGFTDPGIPDTHIAVWEWGDSNTDTIDPAISPMTGSHEYTSPGVYTVKLTVTDDDGDWGESVYRYVVIYDPTGGFVTGGGWIDSPEGAYTADPPLTGKANFGFVSKYNKVANTPSGNTEFQFKVANLNFHSTSYQWLVVNQNGTNAQFKGTGTINGMGEYNFMIWAGDGDPDTLRIKIWEEDEFGVETVIYDNGIEQPISGGSIVIH